VGVISQCVFSIASQLSDGSLPFRQSPPIKSFELLHSYYVFWRDVSGAPMLKAPDWNKSLTLKNW